jgi:hypothetical protein
VPLRGIKNASWKVERDGNRHRSLSAKLKMQNAEYTWLSRFEDWSIISAALH